MKIEDLIKESANEFIGGNEKVASDNSFDSKEAKKVSGYLLKLASYPLKESTYDATKGIMKIASESLTSALSLLNDQAKTIEKLEKSAQVRSIIDSMRSKSLIDDYDIPEKIAEYIKKDKRELEIVKEAIKLADRSSSNRLFDNESEKTASVSGGTSGMFDGVIDE